jgi:hypothetical protein
VFAIVIATAYEGEPSVETTSVNFNELDIQSDRVILTLTPEISITNPNRSPLEAIIKKLTADVYSLDRDAADEVGELIYLGQSTLPAEVNVAPEAETKFEMTIDANVVLPDSAPLSTRLSRDCAPLLSQKLTKFRIILKDAEASFMGVSIPLDDLLPTIDVEAGCP